MLMKAKDCQRHVNFKSMPYLLALVGVVQMGVGMRESQS